MKTEKAVTISALNITMHPHSPEKYISLIKKAEKSKTAIRVQGDVYLQLIRGIFQIDIKDPQKGIYGEIAKFTDIPKDAQWIDLETESAAGEETLRAVKIPKNLKPNYQPFTFIFFPKTHKLVYESKNGKYQLSPNYVHRLFQGLFELEELKKKFGKVDITVMPQKEKIDELLSIPKLKTLKIRITRPNPDDIGDELDRLILEELDSENVRVEIIEKKSVKGKNLKPNEDTKNLARVAATNGFVEAAGFDTKDIPVYDSTKSHPFKHFFIFDPGKISLLDAIYSAAIKIPELFKK